MNLERRVLAFASAVEAGTGLVAIAVPALLIRFLLGLDASADGLMVVRCFGVAILALGFACWPGSSQAGASLRAMLIYNTLIALYLGYLGGIEHGGGLLLWPAVVLHGVVAVILIWASRRPAQS